MVLRKSLEIEIPVQREHTRRPALRILMPAADGLALLFALIIGRSFPWGIVLVALTFVALNADGSRAYRLDPRVGQETGWLLSRIATPSLALLTLASLGLLPGLSGTEAMGRLVMTGSGAVVLVVTGRAAAYAIDRALRARGWLAERTILVGSGSMGVELAELLDRYPGYGLRPIGFIDGSTPSTDDLPLPVLGALDELGDVVERFEVRRVVVAFGQSSDADLAAILRELEGVPVEIHVAPRFFELGSLPPGTADDLRGIPLVHLRRPAQRPVARITKRAFDIVVASLSLVLLTPILLVGAIAVRLSSPGPVLFRQRRVGRNGETFEIIKFRTMVVNEESDISWSTPEDQVTPVGRILRRASVDELPQLINVLKGDMSIVGPRPERPHFVERFASVNPRYVHRHRMHGGITGLAQIHGRSRELDSIPERARLDNAYIEGWSLWGDIVIMARTMGLVFRGDSGSQ